MLGFAISTFAMGVVLGVVSVLLFLTVNAHIQVLQREEGLEEILKDIEVKKKL